MFQRVLPRRTLAAPFAGVVVRWRIVGCGKFRIRVLRLGHGPGGTPEVTGVTAGPEVAIAPGPGKVNCYHSVSFRRGVAFEHFRIHTFSVHLPIARGEFVGIDFLGHRGYPHGGGLVGRNYRRAHVSETSSPVSSGETLPYVDAGGEAETFVNADVSR
jgi:hypothetical protein